MAGTAIMCAGIWQHDAYCIGGVVLLFFGIGCTVEATKGAK